MTLLGVNIPNRIASLNVNTHNYWTRNEEAKTDGNENYFIILIGNLTLHFPQLIPKQENSVSWTGSDMKHSTPKQQYLHSFKK